MIVGYEMTPDLTMIEVQALLGEKDMVIFKLSKEYQALAKRFDDVVTERNVYYSELKKLGWTEEENKENG